MSEKSKRYNMCKDQDAQIDCRIRKCIYNRGGGYCNNISPAITILKESVNCWSFKKG